MLKRRLTNQKGFTLTELAITTVVFAIVTVTVGVSLVDGHRGWNNMYNRVYSDVVTDSYVASKMFEAMVRRASKERVLLDEAGDWVEVYYYSDSDSSAVDRYMRFYGSDGALNVEYGQLSPRETLATETVCENVSECVFRGAGRSVQMMLILDDGSQAITVVCSGVMHNQ